MILHRLGSRRRVFGGGLTALLLLLVLGACASLKPKQLQVSVVSVRLLEAGFAEQKFGLTLEVLNPNGREYVINRLDCQLEVAGAPFARGTFNRDIVLAADGRTVVELPVKMRLKEFLNTAGGRLLAGIGPAGKGEISYRLQGSALVDGVWVIPFDRTGMIDLLNQEKAPAGF